jgi:hypothetical protein
MLIECEDGVRQMPRAGPLIVVIEECDVFAAGCGKAAIPGCGRSCTWRIELVASQQPESWSKLSGEPRVVVDDLSRRTVIRDDRFEFNIALRCNTAHGALEKVCSIPRGGNNANARRRL